jgi:PilZ domain-containing protein
MPYGAEIAETEPKTGNRRRYPRYPLRSLSYVKLDQTNGGIIRDLTESGIAIQAVAPLQPDREVRIAFDLISPRVRVETFARVSWSDANGQGGLQFSGLPPRTQRALRDWLLTQMLSAASISGRDSIFHSVEPQLILSAASRPAILLPPPTEPVSAGPRVSWGFFSVSAKAFGAFVDTVVLLCAILLFGISSVAVMGGLPSWPLATAFFLTAFLIFIAVYQLLFSDLICGATPGKRLALFAGTRSADEESIPRFR